MPGKSLTELVKGLAETTGQKASCTTPEQNDDANNVKIVSASHRPKQHPNPVFLVGVGVECALESSSLLLAAMV